MRTFGAARHDVRRWFRWSSREGALAPDRIETPPAQGGGHLAGSRYARWRSLLDHREAAAGPTAEEGAGWIRWSSREGALAPDRIETHLRRAAGSSPGLDT